MVDPPTGALRAVLHDLPDDLDSDPFPADLADRALRQAARQRRRRRTIYAPALTFGVVVALVVGIADVLVERPPVVGSSVSSETRTADPATSSAPNPVPLTPGPSEPAGRGRGPAGDRATARVEGTGRPSATSHPVGAGSGR